MTHTTHKIGLFGGTFDPPHLGHLISAQSIAEQVGMEKVIFLPVGNPPHKNNLNVSSGKHRLEMTKIAIADNPLFELSDWEVSQENQSYTFNTVKHFQKHMQTNEELYWIIGADSLADLPTWFEFEALIESTKIVTAYRGGIDIENVLSTLKIRLKPSYYEKLRNNIVKTPMIEIAARDLRKRIQNGQSLQYQVPAKVKAYIDNQGLYK